MLDWLQRILPCDIDELLAYRMPRYVYLQHRMLGFTQWVLIMAVFVYIIVFEIIINKGYLEPEAPSGYSRINPQRPAWYPLPSDLSAAYSYCCDPSNTTATANGCSPAWDATPGSLPKGARTRLPCLAWDENQVAAPFAEEYSTLISTRVTVTEYSAVAASCRLNINNGCAASKAARTMRKRDYYVADPERISLMVQHTVYAAGIGNIRQSSGNFRGDDIVHATMTTHRGDFFMNFCAEDASDAANTQVHQNQRRGSLTDDDTSCDDNTRRRDRFGDIFLVGQILDAAEVAASVTGCTNGLDCPNVQDTGSAKDTYRYDGVVLLVPVEFTNVPGRTSALQYEYRPKWVRGENWDHKFVRSEWVGGTETIYNHHGVRMQIVHIGTIGVFQFIEVLKTLVAGAALFAIASFVIERIVLVLPFWKGAQFVFDRYAHIYSHDFSTIVWEDNKDDPAVPVAKIRTKGGNLIQLQDIHFTRGQTNGRFQGQGGVPQRVCGCFRKAPEIDEEGNEKEDKDIEEEDYPLGDGGSPQAGVVGPPVPPPSHEPVV